MSEPDYDAISARLALVTSGPWYQQWTADDTPVVARDIPHGASVLFEADWGTSSDAAFIAAAPTDIAALLARARLLEAVAVQAENLAIAYYVLHGADEHFVRLQNSFKALLDAAPVVESVRP